LHGTPGLKPEKVATLDLSVSYEANRFQGALTYFRSRQTDSIVVDTRPVRAVLVNLGEAAFHGVELEGKYYLRKSFFVSGSVSYQGNVDGEGNRDITPVPSFGAKGGLSYRAGNGLTLSMFDNYQGVLRGFSNATVNPGSSAYHLLWRQCPVRPFALLGVQEQERRSLFAHAENLANYQMWLPDWGTRAIPYPSAAAGQSISVSNFRWEKSNPRTYGGKP